MPIADSGEDCDASSIESLGIIYLTVDDIIAIHGLIFGCDERESRNQIRGVDQLEAALHRPTDYAHYHEAEEDIDPLEGPDIVLLAAATAHAKLE